MHFSIVNRVTSLMGKKTVVLFSLSIFWYDEYFHGNSHHSTGPRQWTWEFRLPTQSNIWTWKTWIVVLLPEGYFMGSWVLNSAQTHGNSQWEPQADPGSTDSQLQLCFLSCPQGLHWTQDKASRVWQSNSLSAPWLANNLW